MKVAGWVFIVVAVMVGLVGLFLVGVGLSGRGDVSVAALLFMALGNLTFCVAMFIGGLVMVRRANSPRPVDPDSAARQVGSPG